MDEWIRSIPLLFAFWLGLLTAISPCPMATNVAAISFLARRVQEPRRATLSGALYTLGRMGAYLVLALLVIHGLLSIPGLAMFLQREMNRLLGPVLLLVGILLTGWFPLKFSGGADGGQAERILERTGLAGAFLIGVLFAVSFCPVSAALFFGSLIPLAVSSGSGWSAPLIYGLGTGLPVFLFALLIVFASERLGRAFAVLTAVELWLRRGTAVIFIGVGVFYILRYTLGVV